MKPKLLLFVFLLSINGLCLLAQDKESIYYASWNKLRPKKVAVFYIDSAYVLLQSEAHPLGRTLYDTLIFQAGRATSHFYTLYFTAKDAYYVSKDSLEKPTPVFLKKYPACHPSTNAFLNWHYACQLHDLVNSQSFRKDYNVLIGKGYYTQPRHEVEKLQGKNVRKKNNIFQRYCPSDFRPMADSVYLVRKQFLDSLPNVR